MIKLRQTIEATKLSNPELSIKLGHSRKYLTNLLNKGCSTAMQNQLIEEINQVMAGTFKTDAEVIAELTQRLAEEQDLVLSKESDIHILQKTNERIKNKYNIIYTENQTLRKNAQNHDIELKRVKDDLDYIKEENDQLRATTLNQNELNKSLNSECAELAEKLGFKTKECHELTEQLNIKNHGEITMNQTIHKLRKSGIYHRIFAFICLAVIVLLSIVKWGV